MFTLFVMNLFVLSNLGLRSLVLGILGLSGGGSHCGGRDGLGNGVALVVLRRLRGPYHCSWLTWLTTCMAACLVTCLVSCMATCLVTCLVSCMVTCVATCLGGGGWRGGL